MKISCNQCGAGLLIMERDFYVRCPYCETSMLVRTPPESTCFVEPAVGPEEAARPFSGQTVAEARLLYFPYIDEGDSQPLRPAFSQLFDELIDYQPPAGDRKLFSPDALSPESLIPLDEDYEPASGGIVVYHPFYNLLLDRGEFNESVLVDAVSAEPLEKSPGSAEEQAESPLSLFRSAVFTGLLVSVPVYLGAVTAGLPIFSRFLIALLLSSSTIAIVVRRRERKREMGR